MADACLCESGLSSLPDYRFFSKRPDFLGIERRVDRSCFLTFRASDARNFEAAGFTFGFVSMAKITAGIYVFVGNLRTRKYIGIVSIQIRNVEIF